LVVVINTHLKPNLFGKLLYNLRLTLRIKYGVDLICSPIGTTNRLKHEMTGLID